MNNSALASLSDLAPAATSVISLEQALNARSHILPSSAAWQQCLQSIYLDYTPTLTSYAQAIYTAWTTPSQVPAIENRVNYRQLMNGLLQLTDVNGNTVFSLNDVGPVVNAFYMQVTILVDTVGLQASYSRGGPSPACANQYISMSDNHPSQSQGEGGCELDDEGLTPNMTIHWTPSALNGQTAVTLTGFRNISDNWALLASLPVAVPNSQDGGWVAYANPTPLADTRATYAFNFTVGDSPIVFWFDPYIGDKK